MNSRFQFREFTISTTRIHLNEFNFTNSRFHLHEFMKMKPGIREVEMPPPVFHKKLPITNDNVERKDFAYYTTT
jgi:hypothetical protein